MPRRKSNDYIDNKKMYAAFVEHRKNLDEAREKGLPSPQISNYLGECFVLLVNRIASRGNFASYTYIDEMKDDGIESCVMGANTFDPSKTNNPFGYFSKTIWMAFLRRIESEHKQTYIKFKSKEMMILSTDEDLSINGSGDNLKIMDNVINNFEEKIAKKRNKSKSIELKKNGTRFIRKKKAAERTDEDYDQPKQNTDLMLIANYIAKGNKINYIPYGVRSTDIPEDKNDVEENILPKEELDTLVDVEEDYNDFE